MKNVLLLIMLSLFMVGVAHAIPQTISDTVYFNSLDAIDENGDSRLNSHGEYNNGGSSGNTDVNRIYGLDHVFYYHMFDVDGWASATHSVLSATWHLTVETDAENTNDWAGLYIFQGNNWTESDLDTGTYVYDLIDFGMPMTGSQIGAWIMGRRYYDPAYNGDFIVTASTLYVTYEDGNPAAPVPEPATILLMGIGLAGIASFQRKRLSKRNEKNNV